MEGEGDGLASVRKAGGRSCGDTDNLVHATRSFAAHLRERGARQAVWVDLTPTGMMSRFNAYRRREKDTPETTYGTPFALGK